jgi:hypothetical protein
MPAGAIAGLNILVAKRWLDRIEACRDQDTSLATFAGLDDVQARGELREVVDLGLGEQDRMPAPGDLGESVGD